MRSHTRTVSMLMAAVVTMAIPALASSVCACETGDTGVGVAGIEGAVARIVQASPAFPAPIQGSEVIQAGFPAEVTYSLAFLDRNGEEDFETPILGSPNPQQLLSVEVLRPDGKFVTDADGIVVPTSNGCASQKVVRTGAGGDAGIAWILMDWIDAMPNNGIVTCDFRIAFNNGAPTPIGIYTVRPGLITGFVPQVATGDVTLEPIGYGPSEDVTTTVYNLQSITTTVGGASGRIDFGTIKPGEIALRMGGIKLTPGNDVVIRNEEASQPVDMMVSMVASDLVQDSTQVPVQGESAIATRTYLPIPCDKVAISMERPPNQSDAMFKSDPGSAYCDTMYFPAIPTLFPGQQIAFNAGLLDPGVGDKNFALASGQYLGTLEVCLIGPGGEGDPIVIGDPPVNPIPSFNWDLAQPVDEMGRAQTAA